MAPSTWTDADIVASNFFEFHICNRFPVLSLGALNWKAHQIAIDNYSSWFRKHTAAGTIVKLEPAGVAIDVKSEAGLSIIPSNRSHTPSTSKCIIKRTKTWSNDGVILSPAPKAFQVSDYMCAYTYIDPFCSYETHCE